jgi:hypothetical protein
VKSMLRGARAKGSGETPAIVVIDTETTGFGHFNRPPREDAIVQVGLSYRDVRGEVVTWGEYCNPGAQFVFPGWADEALKANGITRAQILQAPSSAKVASELQLRLKAIQDDLRSQIQLRSYNRDFDEPFLAANPWSVPTAAWGPCIMLDATRFLDGEDARWVSLKTAMQRLRLEWPGRAHDARTDSHAALLVLEAI